MISREFIFKSEDETRRFAAECADKAFAGSCFALYGEMGSGKTLFSKAFAKALGVIDEVTSPTFTLCEEYEGRLPFYHFDLYRIESDAEFTTLSFEEYWEGAGVSVIEWAGRAESRLPRHAVKLYLEYIDENSRRIRIEYPDM